jgi:hypothetical protein
MVNISKMLMITALLVILLAVVLKLGNARCVVGFIDIRLVSLLVVSNTLLLLGIFLKK